MGTLASREDLDERLQNKALRQGQHCLLQAIVRD